MPRLALALDHVNTNLWSLLSANLMHASLPVCHQSIIVQKASEPMASASAEERMSQYRISRTLGVGSFGKVLPDCCATFQGSTHFKGVASEVLAEADEKQDLSRLSRKRRRAPS